MKQQYFLELNTAIRDFVWCNKRTKVSHKILSLDKRHGGLRLVDLCARQSALKTQWIVLINALPFWSSLVYHQLRFPVADAVWHGNLRTDDVHFILKDNVDPFWYQVFEGWAKFAYTKPEGFDSIVNQPLWLNSHIRSNNRPMVNIQAIAKGFKRIGQLYDDNYNFKTSREIFQQYGIRLSWLDLHRIILAIPQEWKDVVSINGNSNECNLTLFTPFDRIINETKIANIVYSKLISIDKLLTGRRMHWQRKLDINISDKQFQKYFANIYSTTISTKYRDFQYRLLIGNIITNRLLFLWKLKDSQLCSLCNLEVEDEIHLFCECVNIQPLLECLKCYIQTHDQQNIFSCLCWQNGKIIFNLVHPKPGSVINLLILIFKQYIYRCRCMNTPLIADQLIYEIESVYTIEHMLAQSSNKMRCHVEKWSVIKDIDSDFGNQQFINQYIDQLCTQDN